LKEDLMEEIVEMIDSVLTNFDDDKNIEVVKQKVNATMHQFPLFAW
jgi:glycine hydroxymethyltransferase